MRLRCWRFVRNLIGVRIRGWIVGLSRRRRVVVVVGVLLAIGVELGHELRGRLLRHRDVLNFRIA